MALYFGQAELTKGWMDELYNVVSKFYRNGVDVATSFNMALLDARNNPNLKAFTDRFKGIYALQDLRQAGKPVEVPTIAQYVASQAGMADLLKQANLDDLATEEFTGELIGKGNSVTTIAEKIAKAYQRIDMAPKAIKDTFSRYFPTVDRPTLARTILLGQKGVDQLVDELAQYEVLAAAGSVVVDFQNTNEEDIITDGANLVIIVVVVVNAVVDPNGGKSLRCDIDAKAMDAAVAAGWWLVPEKQQRTARTPMTQTPTSAPHWWHWGCGHVPSMGWRCGVVENGDGEEAARGIKQKLVIAVVEDGSTDGGNTALWIADT